MNAVGSLSWVSVGQVQSSDIEELSFFGSFSDGVLWHVDGDLLWAESRMIASMVDVDLWVDLSDLVLRSLNLEGTVSECLYRVHFGVVDGSILEQLDADIFGRLSVTDQFSDNSHCLFTSDDAAQRISEQK